MTEVWFLPSFSDPQNPPSVPILPERVGQGKTDSAKCAPFSARKIPGMVFLTSEIEKNLISAN